VDRLGSLGSFIFEGFRFDSSSGGLFQTNGAGVAPVVLGSRAVALLALLVERHGQLVSKDEIFAAVWPGIVVGEANLTVQISALRRVLDNGETGGSCIQTVFGRGYRFVLPVTRRGPESAPESPGVKASILVLPFRNVTGDPTQDYLTDAVTSDLTVDLSRIRDIVVISAATALTFKGTTLDTRQIAREVGVRYLVVGTIARVGDLIRTTAQLLDANSGVQVWGDRFENRFIDIGGMEDEITGRLAASLDIQLIRAEGQRAEAAAQPDALDLRLRATSLLDRCTLPEHTLATRELLQRSAALDPRSAETWARLGQVIVSDYLNSWNEIGRKELRAAENAFRRALQIDGPSGAGSRAAC
jgi:TolB-like protein